MHNLLRISLLEGMENVTGGTYRLEVRRVVTNGRTRIWVRPDFAATTPTGNKKKPEVK